MTLVVFGDDSRSPPKRMCWCTATVAGAGKLRRPRAWPRFVGVSVFHHTGGSDPLAISGIALALLLGSRSAELGWNAATVFLLAMAIPAAAIGAELSGVVNVLVQVAQFLAVPFAVGRVMVTRSQAAETLRADNTRLEQEQRERARQAAGEERSRVARELHDVVAPASA